MSKKIPEKLNVWIEARKRFHLSHDQVQMARELGMNPKNFGKLANHKQERWKVPLPEYIEELYRKRFGKAAPDQVKSIEQLAKDQNRKKAERKQRREEKKLIEVFFSETDLLHLRAAIEIARQSREHGNHPFGALLVDENGTVLLQAENTVVAERDCTGHAETNLMRMASKQFAAEQLAKCTLYTSTEPCAMCCGAIYWGHVGRVVYALSSESLHRLAGDVGRLRIPSQYVFARGTREVLGPTLQEEAIKVHEGFW